MLLKLIILLLLALLVLLKPIHTQVVHWQAALQCLTPLPSRWTTFTAEPPSRIRLLLLGCRSKLRPACSSKGTRTPRLAFYAKSWFGTYTSGYNNRTYLNPNDNYQAMYTTVSYTDPISLPGSSLGFLPNHAYQNAPRFNAYGQPKANDFGYETPPLFPFRL
jgi:hypothetical protein